MNHYSQSGPKAIIIDDRPVSQTDVITVITASGRWRLMGGWYKPDSVGPIGHGHLNFPPQEHRKDLRVRVTRLDF